jgi:hypothetical protein
MEEEPHSVLKMEGADSGWLSVFIDELEEEVR